LDIGFAVTRTRAFYLLLPLLTAGYAVLAQFSPGKYLKAGVLGIAAAIGFVVYLFPATFLGLGIFALAAAPEYLLTPVLAINETRTLHRLALLFLLAASIWRYGFALRSNPPVVALVMILSVSLLGADFLPSLTLFQMIKSLIGLSLPFLFLHCVYQRETIDRYLNMIALMPLFCVVGGIFLDAAGIHNFYPAEYSTGVHRLGGMTIPAYLAFYGYVAFFVCCYQILKTSRRGYYLLGGINLLIILMTGTRTPMLMAAILGVAIMFFAPQQSLKYSVRVKVAFAGSVLFAAALFVLWPQIEPRLFGTAGGGTSGRSFIWAYYIAEIAKNPWFGRGFGSGVILLDTIDDYRVDYTNAAHNEYLRILMDGGIVGLVMLIVGMALWVRSECRFMLKEERVLFLAFMLTFVLASFTDNTLSSPPTLVTFFTLSLMIQRARQRAKVPAPTPVGARLVAPPRRPPTSMQPAPGQ
jgi:teichuronic acid biosynthesis protein TuaE